ncbi:hypothetical protein DFQ00_10959 [Paenibacillus barcinonensis]|uniref:Uncharacterized protein n=2 Tax=Paenibacillus barcinonensis TaxID=198119 RepID=A0A2V4V731_PAEBA|nr:hypothetical protein [Paenibacillus barcinonensis]PYE48205.1 hypothetical protein DFQ00_10959 [Paenibacillus barcinonensis]
MVNDDLSPKNGRFVRQRKGRLISPFIFSMMIGVIYAALITNETAIIYINKILPSTDGADLHQYLPVMLPAFIYSYAVQRKRIIWLENLSFSCIQALIAVMSFAACLVTAMLIM